MVSPLEERAEISKEMEIYMMTGGTFIFDMDIHDKKTKMPGKLYFVSNFIVSSYFASAFKFQFFSYVSLICCRYMVDNLWWQSTQSPKACYLCAHPNM